MQIEWTPERVEHMWERHRVTPAEANEALNDVDRLVEHPDHASKNGQTDRVIGYSRTHRRVLCVIIAPAEGFGINAWPANVSYRRRYERGE